MHPNINIRRFYKFLLSVTRSDHTANEWDGGEEGGADMARDPC